MFKIISSFCLLAILISSCNSSSNRVVDEVKLDAIPVELTTHLGDQQLFIEGDEIQFLLSLGQDAYIYMYYIDADNRITQILPNPNQRSHFYSAGYFLTIPEYENLYRVRISAPFGEELIQVFASDQSISPEQSLDSIESIRDEIRNASNRAFGEYELKITTRPGR